MTKEPGPSLVPDRVRDCRKELGYSQEKLSEVSGVSQSTISRIVADALHQRDPISLRAIAGSIGLDLSPRAPSGCHGEIEVAEMRVRFDGRGGPRKARRRLAHEIGHWAMALGDESPPHDEIGADLVGMAIALERTRVRSVVQRVGLHRPTVLARELGECGALWAILRAAWLCERAAIVVLGRERFSIAPDSHEVPPWGGWEQEITEAALVTGKPQRGLYGGIARPFETDDEGRGVLFLPQADD